MEAKVKINRNAQCLENSERTQTKVGTKDGEVTLKEDVGPAEFGHWRRSSVMVDD